MQAINRGCTNEGDRDRMFGRRPADAPVARHAPERPTHRRRSHARRVQRGVALRGDICALRQLRPYPKLAVIQLIGVNRISRSASIKVMFALRRSGCGVADRVRHYLGLIDGCGIAHAKMKIPLANIAYNIDRLVLDRSLLR